MSKNMQITPKGKLALIFGIKQHVKIGQINENIRKALKENNAVFVVYKNEVELMCKETGEGFNISGYDALYDILITNKSEKSTNAIISQFKEYMIKNNVCICSEESKLIFAPIKQ